MKSWTRHLARLLRCPGQRSGHEPEPPAVPAPPCSLMPRSEIDSALIRACAALQAQHARGAQALAGLADGDWRRFADAVAESDGAAREALDRVIDTPAESAAGLRAKADALRTVLDGVGEDAELTSRIARSLVTDALAVLAPRIGDEVFRHRTEATRGG